MTGTVDRDAVILANRTRRTARADVAGEALADDLAAGHDNCPASGAAPDTDDDPGAIEIAATAQDILKSKFRFLIFAGNDATTTFLKSRRRRIAFRRNSTGPDTSSSRSWSADAPDVMF
jgi:hypothetical protein